MIAREGPTRRLIAVSTVAEAEEVQSQLGAVADVLIVTTGCAAGFLRVITIIGAGE